MNVKMLSIVALVLVVLVVAAFLLLGKHAQAPPTHVILPSAPTSPNTLSNKTTAPQNATTNTTSLNTTRNQTTYINCVSPNPTFPIDNGDFGTGTYAGWNITGQGFINSQGKALPTNLSFANQNDQYYGQPWSNYGGSYFATTYVGGISLSTGNLTSNPFAVREPYLDFKISSAPSSLLYLELLYQGRPYYIEHFNTLNASGGNNPQSTFENATLPLFNMLCKNVSVRVVSGVVGSISTVHDLIAVGDFVQSKIPVQTPGIVINSTFVNPTA